MKPPVDSLFDIDGDKFQGTVNLIINSGKTTKMDIVASSGNINDVEID